MRSGLAVLALAVGATVTAAAAGMSSSGAIVRPCQAQVQKGVLPTWARGGFSDRETRIPHVLGRSQRIVGILFGYPLLSPPRAGRNNKILWVAHKTPNASALRIRAQRMNGTSPVGRPVTRKVSGGPGPSIINLPSSGCWRLTLRWSNRIDSLDLRYLQRP
jgi:hypothetical protein